MALTLSLMALLGSGCGGDGPQASFMREADDICARHRPAVKVRGTAPTLRSARADTRALHAGLQRRVSALQRLERPRGDEEQIGRWLDQLRANALVLDRLESALRRGRLEAARRPQAVYAAGDLRARELARAYGLNRCAQG